jgi:transcription initiation factor TFIIB
VDELYPEEGAVTKTYIKRESLDLIKNARRSNITQGKSPRSMAGAAIYITGVRLNNRKTQREIADISYVTEVSVRQRYKDMVEALEIVHPDHEAVLA